MLQSRQRTGTCLVWNEVFTGELKTSWSRILWTYSHHQYQVKRREDWKEGSRAGVSTCALSKVRLLNHHFYNGRYRSVIGNFFLLVMEGLNNYRNRKEQRKVLNVLNKGKIVLDSVEKPVLCQGCSSQVYYMLKAALSFAYQSK